MSQALLLNRAAGSPQEEGFGDFSVISEGISSREKNHILIASAFQSIASTHGNQFVTATEIDHWNSQTPPPC